MLCQRKPTASSLDLTGAWACIKALNVGAFAAVTLFPAAIERATEPSSRRESSCRPAHERGSLGRCASTGISTSLGFAKSYDQLFIEVTTVIGQQKCEWLIINNNTNGALVSQDMPCRSLQLGIDPRSIRCYLEHVGLRSELAVQRYFRCGCGAALLPSSR